MAERFAPRNLGERDLLVFLGYQTPRTLDMDEIRVECCPDMTDEDLIVFLKTGQKTWEFTDRSPLGIQPAKDGS
jgi:hypothetical protein